MGGATFDTMPRFLGEDPWERPKVLKKYIKKPPFPMLLRGQNLAGYRIYADDVVGAFDALNGIRSFETCVERIKAGQSDINGCASRVQSFEILGVHRALEVRL
jgi:pyruvate/oxaloacetate carboxyltransferase